MGLSVKEIGLSGLRSHSPFQSEFWACAKSNSWRAQAFYVEEKGNILVLSRTFLRRFTLSYVPFGPEGKYTEEELLSLSKELKAFLPKNTFLLRYDLPWDYPDSFNPKDFLKCKDSVQADGTVRITLKEDFKLSERAKRNLKKESDVTVSLYEGNEKEFDKWHETYVETGVRDGFTTRPKAYVKAMLGLKDKGVEPRLYIAKRGNEIVGGIFNLRTGSEEVYLYGSSKKWGKGIGPGYILQKTAMESAKEDGIKTYDMFGIPGRNSGEHLRSLKLFKTAFGGRELYRPPSLDYPIKPILAHAYRFLEELRYRLNRKAKH